MRESKEPLVINRRGCALTSTDAEPELRRPRARHWWDAGLKAWRAVEPPLQTLSACRASVVGVLVGLALLADQGLDLFRALDHSGFGRAWATLAALIWATNVWYWARTTCALTIPVGAGASARSQRVVWLGTWTPRALGTSALGLFTLAIHLAAEGTTKPTQKSTRLNSSHVSESRMPSSA